MELWDVYDKERKKTGKIIQRGGAFASDEYHLVVHVCIFNSKDEMLIQQRQPFKEGWSNMWDLTVGGSAIQGENSQMAAERELFEEIGLKLDLHNIMPYITINTEWCFDDIYLIQKDIDIDSLKLQYEEVQQVKWANSYEIFKMIDNGIFIPYYKSLIQLLFDKRGNYDGRQLKE